MQRNWIVLAAAALAAWPGGLAAQQRTPRPPREPRAFAYSFDDNRGRIGVIVRTDANSETDKIGAKIEGVTPGGPADKAGLKVGDIITKFKGTALADAGVEEEDESGPGRKLVELARKLEPGDTVQVEYRRGGETRKATIVAQDLGVAFNFDMPHMPEFRMPGMERITVCMGELWCDLDLVTLNADLGEYFGTKEGVLVVKAPADSGLPLKSGDVILAIGGRKPSSPSHAMRILRSYDAGETVSIDIMRKQKRLTVTWKVPAREERSFRRHEQREDQSRFRWRVSHRPRVQRV